jgi:transcriptional regulatory protein LEU3
VVPLMDPSWSPNHFYEQAPLLFWVIVAIGSRKLTTHPSLTCALAPRVTQQAFMSLNSRSMPLQCIKGLVLLLSWPFSSTSFYRDTSYVLSGALLHKAMQCGLHTPVLTHDFSKKRPARVATKEELLRRAELWTHVVLTYQR